LATTGSATVRARSSGGALADLADFGRRLWVKGGEDDVLFLAGGVAFNILLAGVPFFLLLASGLGYVLGKSQAASNTAVAANAAADDANRYRRSGTTLYVFKLPG